MTQSGSETETEGMACGAAAAERAAGGAAKEAWGLANRTGVILKCLF